MRFERIPEQIDAWQIQSSGQAATVTGHEPDEPYAGEDWAIRWTGAGGVELHLGGRAGDFLTPAGGAWQRIRQAQFETDWQLPGPDNLGGIRDSNLR